MPKLDKVPETTLSRELAQMVATIRATLVAIVRRDGPDLSARQLGIFLLVYLRKDAQTVRSLAAQLDIAKPAVTRALDRLTELGLARRKPDPLDGRSIVVQRTLKGAAFLRDLRGIMIEAHAEAEKSDLRRGDDRRPTAGSWPSPELIE